MRAIAALALGLTLVLSSDACSALERSGESYEALHIWSVGSDPVKLEAWTDQHLVLAQADIDALLAVKGPRTLANTVRPFDDANNQLTIAESQTYQMSSLHPDAAIRDKAEFLAQKVSAASTALSLNHDVYEALLVVPTDALDASSRELVERTLLEYRLSGVDRDEATRAQVQELEDGISQASTQFHDNINADVRHVDAQRTELDGLSADFVAGHPGDGAGGIVLSTSESDVDTVERFASSALLRRRLFVAYNQRAYPANRAVLMQLLQQRYELAQLLGYRSFADLDLKDEMIDSPQHLDAFLDELGGVTREVARREYKQLLHFARSRDGSVTSISQSDRAYWIEQYRKSVYQVDAQALRAYFPYEAVQAGVMKTAARLFHVEFKPVSDAPVWDSSVQTFDVIDQGKKIGRIYLDMHARAGKDPWSSSTPLVPGLRGRQWPEAALVCNFPGGTASDPGLMQVQDVALFFREFGHLMHHVLSGQGAWSELESFNVERDFIDAPSQMLEELFHDPHVLESFARRAETQEPIPADLVARMNASLAFGRGLSWQHQMLYATYAFQIHDVDPAHLDLDAVLQADTRHLTVTEQIEGNHMYASFTHLADYGPKYYGYLLDKVIALDFYAQFDRDDRFEGATALRYRKTVIDPGASRPAEQLVHDFLGRGPSIDAFRDWLEVEFQGPQPTLHRF